MKSTAECPDPSEFHSLLAGAIGDSAEFKLQCHLDECSDCRLHLESLAALDDGVAERIKDNLGSESTFITAALSNVIQRFGNDIAKTVVTAEDRRAADQTALDCLLSSGSTPDVFGNLGQYEVSGVIGQGGMGVVFKGTDPKLHRPVAVKVLSPQLSSNPSARARFIREARAQAAVNHPNLVTIYEVSELAEQDLPFLVMEFVEGESLQDWITREGHLSPEETARVGAEIAAGLDAAHSAGIIHRDIKPANILIDHHTRTARITDFGLALVLDELDDRITQTGTVSGTPRYMSPEQIADQDVDHRTDLFSLGTLLYVAATGEPPFPANTHRRVLDRILAGSPTPIHEHQPTIPNWLVTVITRLHQPDPNQRFQNASQTHAALLAGAPVEIPPTEIEKRKRETALRWLAGGVMLLLCFAFMFARMSGEPIPTSTETAAGEAADQASGTDATLIEQPNPAPKVIDPSGPEIFVRTRVQLVRAIQRGEARIVLTSDRPIIMNPVNIERPVSIRSARGKSRQLITNPQAEPSEAMFDVRPGGSLAIKGVSLLLPPIKGNNADSPARFLIRADNSAVRITECGLTARSGVACVDIKGLATAQIRNTRFESEERAAVHWEPAANSDITVHNSHHDGRTFARVAINTTGQGKRTIRLTDCTIRSPRVFELSGTGSTATDPVQLHANGCVFDSETIKRCLIHVEGPVQHDTEAASRSWLQRNVRWNGRLNLYAQPTRRIRRAAFIEWPSATSTAWQPATMVHWEQFWNIPRSDASIISRVIYGDHRPFPEVSSLLRFGADPRSLGSTRDN